VPLAPLARELLANAAGELIFSGTGWSRLKRRLDRRMLDLARKERGAAAAIRPWRLHDLRRTFVTGLGDLGVRGEILELCINHISGTRGGVAGIYNRSTLLPERKETFERWALHVAGIVEQRPANITRLRRPAAQ
jgi:hypothetical protein